MAENFDVALNIRAKDNTAGALGKTRAGLESISGQLARIQTLFIGWQASVLSLGSMKALATFADDVQLVNGRLKLAVASTQEFAQAQQFAYQVASQTGAGYEAVATLYTRLAQGSSAYGLSQEKIATVTEATANALRVSGASATESASVIRQLSQALGSGVLRGDEFNSIMENGGRLAKALADGLGLSVGQLRGLAEQGLLTTDVVTQAVQSQSAALSAEASRLPRTIGQATSSVQDAFGRMLDQFNRTAGVTRGVAGMFDTLAKHMDVAFGAAALAAAGAFAVAIARAAGSVASSVTDFMARNAAQRQALATEIAHRQAVLSYAQAELAAAQATVARTNGMARLAAVQTTLVPAQQRLAVAQAASTAAMGAGSAVAIGLRGALAAIGGPLGVILTVLSLGATAWAMWGNNAKSATDKASDALERARGVAERLRREKTFGAGDAGVLREAIAQIEARIEKDQRDIVTLSEAGVRARGAPILRARKDLEAARTELAMLKKDLDTALTNEMGGDVPGAPTAAGRALLKKSWDAYVRQYNEGADRLTDAIADLREQAKKAGIAEDSPEFRAALAKVKAKLGKDDAVARLPQLRRDFDAELQLTKSALSDQEKVIEASLKGRLIDDEAYWNARQALQQAQFDTERRGIEQALTAQEELIERLSRAQAGNAGQREELAGRLASARAEADKLRAELTALDGRQVSARFVLKVDREQSRREIDDAITGAQAELARLTGAETPQMRRETVAREFRDLIARMGSDAEGVALVNRLIDVKTASADLDALERRWQGTLESMRNSEESANIRSQQGLITSAQAQTEIAAAHEQASRVMTTLVPQMEAAANAIGPEAVRRVTAWKNELASVQTVVDPLADALNTSFKDAFSTMFEQIGSGAKSARDAFLDFSRSVIGAINRIAAQRLAESLFGSGKGGGGLGGIVGGLLKAIGFASGGYVSGPGSATSDSIPARLSAGEYVLRAAAVRRLGVAFLDQLNGGLFAPALAAGRFAFADGGLATAQMAPGAAGQMVRIVNVIDPGMAADYLNSASGERTILNVLSRNGQAVREILR